MSDDRWAKVSELAREAHIRTSLNRGREPLRVCVCIYLLVYVGQESLYRAGDRFGLNLDPYYNSRTAAAAGDRSLLGGKLDRQLQCTHTTWKHSTTTQHLFSTITMDTILAGGYQKIAAQIQITKWRPIFSIALER